MSYPSILPKPLIASNWSYKDNKIITEFENSATVQRLTTNQPREQFEISFLFTAFDYLLFDQWYKEVWKYGSVYQSIPVLKYTSNFIEDIEEINLITIGEPQRTSRADGNFNVVLLCETKTALTIGLGDLTMEFITNLDEIKTLLDELNTATMELRQTWTTNNQFKNI